MMYYLAREVLSNWLHTEPMEFVDWCCKMPGKRLIFPMQFYVNGHLHSSEIQTVKLAVDQAAVAMKWDNQPESNYINLTRFLWSLSMYESLGRIVHVCYLDCKLPRAERTMKDITRLLRHISKSYLPWISLPFEAEIAEELRREAEDDDWKPLEAKRYQNARQEWVNAITGYRLVNFAAIATVLTDIRFESPVACLTLSYL
jgi:hypothetical protein